jgi:hypothetical protein
MEIPNLGKLIIKSGIAAIEFDEYLQRDTLVIENKIHIVYTLFLYFE